MISPQNETLIKAYFDAWTTHSVSGIQALFRNDAQYHIQNKRVLCGAVQIVDYWERNRKRQRNLKVLPYLITESGANSASCVFCSTFIDVEEQEKQTVYGIISFVFDDEKIANLTESYHLAREKSERVNAIWQGLRDVGRRVKWWTLTAVRRGFEFVLTRAATVLSLLMAVLLGYSAFQLSDMPDWLLCGLDFNFAKCITITEPERQLLLKKAFRNLSGLTAAFLIGSLFLGWLRYRLRHPINIIPVQAEGHDLQVMRERYAAARAVTIFAGDFSFVSADKPMREMLLELQSHGRLRLVSDRDEATVRSGFGVEPEAVSLFEDLKREERIRFDRFDRGAKIRCSIVERWDHSEILYRYKGGGADSWNDLSICVLRGRKEAAPVTELVRKLADKVSN